LNGKLLIAEAQLGKAEREEIAQIATSLLDLERTKCGYNAEKAATESKQNALSLLDEISTSLQSDMIQE